MRMENGAGWGCLLVLLVLAQPAWAAAPASLRDLALNAAGDGFELTLEFDGPSPQPEQFMLPSPARLVLDFPDVSSALPERRYAIPFAGADSVTVLEGGGRTRVVLNLGQVAPYSTRIQDNTLVVAVTPVDAVSQYTGEPISLNFQDIEVRTALQLLADFSDFSLVVGDSVTGTMTLRLDDVPWDLALDMVLRPCGLDKRVVGQVLYVAPAAEITEAELRETEVAPLVTEYFRINYARAQDVLLLLRGGSTTDAVPGAEAGTAAAGSGAQQGLLSERGRASSDARTNTIIVQDVQAVIDDIWHLVERIDIPVRQVLIEARIVNASTSFSKALGVRWGGTHVLRDTGDRFTLGASLADPEALLVDLGVEPAASSIAIGYQGDNGLLQLELSALEASGNGEVIAQPQVTTQDKQQARIESGLQIPYQAQAGGTAGGSTTEFITAALSLDVTPQITPDGRIIMLLDIHQDSVITGSGAVPAIATNSVNTRVLVNDGETIVLGGVFREEVTTSVTKALLLGDLPYVGPLFKRTANAENKTELLVFITPRIIQELR